MAKRKPAATAETAPAAPSGNYTVLARRYRPQQFADLIGQEHVAQALTNALQSGRVAHAYLFTGARGVGKTSCARILAKALNCEKGPTVTPCDACEICQGIMAGDDVDVVEIDGASNNSVDNVRELRQNVQFRPSRARFKIYIVDEVHMLSTGAFNALLKTLEEPPAHVKFIFATTAADKVPITIRSRCQRFEFAGISVKCIVAQLQRIVASENMQADDAALELVARRAAGSMRDAESLLDQLLAFSGDKLTADQVHGLLGTAHDDRVVALAGAVLGQNGAEVLQVLGAAADEGLDLGELLNQLVDYWRDLMIVHCAGVEGQTLSVGSNHQETLATQAKTLSLDTILAGLDILVAAKNKMKFSSQHGRVLVEAALLRLTQLGNLVSLAQLAQWLKNPGERGRVSAPSTAPAAALRTRGADATPLDPAAPRKLSGILPAEDTKKKLLTAAASQLADAAEPRRADATPLATTPETRALTVEVWPELLAQQSGILAADLQKNAGLAISAPNTLVIRFPSGYNLARDRCQDKVGQLELALQKIVGQPCKIRIETIEVTGTGQSMDNSAGLSVATGARRADERIAEIPLIKKAREILGAQILDRNTDPNFGTWTAPAAGPADQE